MSALYDDIDVLDGVPLSSNNRDGGTPLVGLRVAANWSGDVGPPTASSNSSLQLMQSHMAAKRAQTRRPQGVSDSGATTGPSSGNQRSSSTLAPVVDLNRRNGGGGDGLFRFNSQTGRLERHHHNGSSSSRLTVSSSSDSVGNSRLQLFGDPILSLGVDDEYDPMTPNDFDLLSRVKRERRRAEENELAASRALAEHSIGTGGSGGSGLCRQPIDSSSSDEEDNSSFNNKRRRGGQSSVVGSSSGAAIAPPAALVAEVGDSTMVPPGTGGDQQVGQIPSGGAQSNSNQMFGAINPLAAKMMARMGYREGQGLGREGQGMATALQVEKTSRRGGKIIHERDQVKQQQSAVVLPPPSESVISQPSLSEDVKSPVILLRNMCGPGEVDDDLEPETFEECAKYGTVIACMVFELPDSPDDEAVRIFVEFASSEGASKAVQDLNGRFFGGRVVKAGYYNADKFRNLELTEQPLN